MNEPKKGKQIIINNFFEVHYLKAVVPTFVMCKSESENAKPIAFILFNELQRLHGPSMFAFKAKIYRVLYKQYSSIAFDETSSYWSALKSS